LVYLVYSIIMKNINKEILMVLRDSESKLQKIIAKAANKSEYDTVDTARTIAEQISILRDKLASSMPQKPSSKEFKPSNYPKFEVKNNRLIRTGWLKKQERGYTHEVSKSFFDLTVKAMASLAQKGAGPVTTEAIIKQIKETESKPIPGYQVYVVIGMLRGKTWIEQEGRKGYKIPIDIETKAEKEWKILAGESSMD